MSTFAGGIQIIAPQAVAIVNEEAVVANQPAASLVVAIIGSADGGKPQSFQPIFNYTQAQAAFRSGSLLDLLRRVYGPAQSVAGAYKVLACRVNNGVQSSFNLKDAAVATVVSLLSSDYGLHTNQVRVKVEAGTVSGYKASVQGYDSSATIIQDNIGRNMMSVTYTGTGTPATLTTSATQLTTAITTATGDSVTLDFATYTTIQNLADALIGTGKYSVTVLADPKTPSATLDVVTAIDILTIKTLAAHVQALVDWFNTSEPYVNATRVTGKPIVAMSTFASLTGGTNGAAVTSTDYQAALTLLQGLECDLVLVGTDDATIHAMADAHCQLMAQAGQNKERVAIVGGTAGENVASTIARAKALSSYRTALAYPGLLDTDAAGASVTLAPMYTAAAIAGILAGGTIGQPATRKPIRCVGPSYNATPAEIDQLIQAGVTVVQPNAVEGARVVQSILTFVQQVNGSLNLLRKEISSRLAADSLIKRVRSRLDDNLIGTAGGPLLREQARSIAETVLKEAETAGLIVGDAAQPAYSQLSANITGDTITVTFRAALATPGNYVILKASLGSFNG